MSVALSRVRRAAARRKAAEAAYREAVAAAAREHRLEDVAAAAGITKQGVSYLVRPRR